MKNITHYDQYSFKQLLRMGRDILRDSQYLSFYIQRFVMNYKARRRWARYIATTLPKSRRVSEDKNTETIASELDGVGFHVIPNLLTPQEVLEMRNYFQNTPCQDRYRPKLGQFLPGVNPPPETHVADPDPSAIIRAPHALKIANNPLILAAMERRFGCKPTIALIHAWWSLKGHNEGEQAELFHRDVDDWDFIKLFVYLTDVDEYSGPHIYISGSATNPKCTELRRYSEDEIYNAFGTDCTTVWNGRAGTAFLENTFGFHRGLPAQKSDRLIFQVVYSLRPIPPRTKAKPLQGADIQPAEEFDRYINRIYIR